MTEEQLILFNKLRQKRIKQIEVLEDPDMSGLLDNAIDKYSEKAHFVYELLQNADDAEATEASFVLKKDEVLFSHNGKQHFSISDVDTQVEDKSKRRLGDINAITASGFSTKSGDDISNTQNKIGKFGLGFKAVFQYTRTPYIYDRDFCFRIERFIVPEILSDDHPEHKKDETLFVFPFNHPKRNASIAFDEISEKLRCLTYPILFLNCLQVLAFTIQSDEGSIHGEYKKKAIWSHEFNDVHAGLLSLEYSAGHDERKEKLWMFSRKLNVGNICVGYLANEDDTLRPCRHSAFCFFPTKVNTELNFIVHAPFLLTDSREGIKENELHNGYMIEELSTLAADSLLLLKEIGSIRGSRLITDDILKIVPLEMHYSMYGGMNFSNSFYEKMQAALENGLLPTEDGYTDSEHAYWADTHRITELFSDKHLSQLVNKSDSHWVFTSLAGSSNDRANDNTSFFIKQVTVFKYIDEAKISNSITVEFIENQSFEWICSFYMWLKESELRFNKFRKRPIFINSNGKAQAAYDEKGRATLFLPSDVDMDCATLQSDFLQDKSVCDFILHTVKLKEPDKKDYINNNIVPLYRNGSMPADVEKHFGVLFDYYIKMSSVDTDEYISIIKDCAFLKYYDKSQNAHYATASELYKPTPELIEYFAVLSETKFVAYDDYATIAGTAQKGYLDKFLDELGINHLPLEKRINYTSIDSADIKRIIGDERYSRLYDYYEIVIDGCIENIDYIINNSDKEKSYMLWAAICSFCRINPHMFANIKGHLSYKYRNSHPKEQTFNHTFKKSITEKLWLIDANGEYVSAKDITADRLDSRYDTKSAAAQILLNYLGIALKSNDNLTDEQREDIELAKAAKELGITSKEKLQELIKLQSQKEAEDLHRTERSTGSVNSTSGSEANNTEPPQQNNTQAESDHESDSFDSVSHVLGRIARNQKKHVRYSDIADNESEFDESVTDTDSDAYTPQEINYSAKIEREEKKVAKEVEKLERLAELQRIATESQKYSYAWFKALLEMEALNSNEQNSHSREISISFSKIEREEGTLRTLVLMHPNKYIPQYLEEVSDIPLVLHFADQTKTVYIEVSSIKSYTLRVKLKSETDLADIDLAAVYEATINVQSPAFLLESLMRGINSLGYEDDFNMRDNLCENIEFIFGPPGTGKTTHLAKNVILPLMKENDIARVLVLAPTNKAADVLVNRIMDESGDDKGYNDWLVRFGVTGDEKIENSGVYRDKTFDIVHTKKSVTVTTIARFAYDHFTINGKWLELSEIDWDYIIIDEASMIPLVNIIYPLYKQQPEKFYIAGDPFQIEPISAVDLWKDENIYKLVQLDSFASPKTVLHDYPVTLLKTQYRSVPSVGSIFSELTYGGILEHARTEDSIKKLNIDDSFFKMKSLNIIKYPVSKYESIYRAKRLQHSSCYHVYSALFTFEFAIKLAEKISASDCENVSIGIIAPYRAQADLIDKLLASASIPKEVSIEAGTIHGFQGDECDIIIAVFNPPPVISASKDVFLNKKNIINVSISRSRDYLFIVMPDEETENINNLRLIKRVENLLIKHDAIDYYAQDMEEWMFGSATYLEDNSFTTGHQNVNVYGLPEKTYEIRTEDAAIDVQIHKKPKPEETIEGVIYVSTGLKGMIVSHRFGTQGEMIDVRFEDGSKQTFLAESAFNSNTLRRI